MKARLLRWLINNSAVKTAQPVVVVESDDWGMSRNELGLDLKAFGSPKFWAEDRCESPADLDDLLNLLNRFENVKFTANYIVSNPNYKKIIESDYRKFVFDGISENTVLTSKVIAAVKSGRFRPQLHGRSHFNSKVWLRDLQEDYLNTRELFALHINGGWNNFNGKDSKRYHSEYLQWNTEENTEEIKKWLQMGFDEFYKAFGFRSESTIAPHYILPERVLNALRDIGVKYVQGANARIFNNRKYIWQGRAHRGVILTNRNLRLEPSRNYTDWTAESAISYAKNLMEAKLPVIVDTHRINYIGKYKDRSLKQFGKLLAFFEMIGVRYLFSDEFGEAIANKGNYIDRVTGKQERLLLIESGSGYQNFLKLWEGIK